jgi:threonine aldolase
LTLRQATRDLGVDVLSFGATKNGAMGAEAVVFFPGAKTRVPHLSSLGEAGISEEFKFYRKQGMQLASKMRFISAQFQALLSGDLWLRNARHANRMGQLLQNELSKIPDVKIVYPVEANGVFAQIPRDAIPKILKRYFFYVWDEKQSIVRWMCSWDTTEDDVKQFVRFLRQTVLK